LYSQLINPFSSSTLAQTHAQYAGSYLQHQQQSKPRISHFFNPFESNQIKLHHQSSKMKYIASALAFATAVAAHGYVNNATIGGKEYIFYQPYQDPYMTDVKRISRPIQGNGPVENVAISDIQCGGYAAGGINGSKPAALHAEAAAGSDVELYWTLWPESHMGPTITYMAKCPDAGCNNWMPESA
jgi:hypothetical protein